MEIVELLKTHRELISEFNISDVLEKFSELPKCEQEELLLNIILKRPGFRYGPLHSASNGNNGILNFLEALYSQSNDSEKLVLNCISTSILIWPMHFHYSYSAQLIEFLHSKFFSIDEREIPQLVDRVSEARTLTYEEAKDRIGDGIDHTFPIPSNFEDRLSIVKIATEHKRLQNQLTLMKRVNNHSQPFIGPKINRAQKIFQSKQAWDKIANDLPCRIIQPQDYLVFWDEIVATFEGYDYTLAEVLRIILLDPSFSFPDTVIREVFNNFYIQCLKIGADAVIGLKSGVFFVEHSLASNPSVFYLGARATLGKGVLIDGVGGSIISSEAFLGGGFLPLLIHTHKHSSLPGIDERKSIAPVIFAMDSKARLPMSYSGLFEAADFLNRPSPFTGVSTIEIV